MGAIKNWCTDMVYVLRDEGYSEIEISKILELDIEFVHALIGAV